MRIPGIQATSFAPDGDAVGTAYLVPGRAYPPVAPLLFFAQSVLLQHRWAVRQVWWDPPAHSSDEQTGTWVRGRVEGVLPDSGRVLLVGKSLATYAAPLAAERGFDAVWLTPLLQVPALVEALAANPGRQLLVGGSADHIAWRPEVARRLAGAGCEVLEVPDADHAMLVPGDAVRGVGIHGEVVRAVDDFVRRLAS